MRHIPSLWMGEKVVTQVNSEPISAPIVRSPDVSQIELVRRTINVTSKRGQVTHPCHRLKLTGRDEGVVLGAS
jgi:hypothetical protein